MADRKAAFKPDVRMTQRTQDQPPRPGKISFRREADMIPQEKPKRQDGPCAVDRRSTVPEYHVSSDAADTALRVSSQSSQNYSIS